WKTLSAKKIAVSLGPDRLAIKEVRLIEPGMKLVIAEDNSVNLKKVLKGNSSGESVVNQESQAKKPAKKPKKGGDKSFPIQISQVRLVNGALEFADQSLVLPFSTRVHSLDGAIAGISTASGSRAEVELAGQVGDYGEASAAGTLLPKDPAKFLDILASFDNVEMPPLSPYSATFAGRKIASGKLWLTLHYKIVDGNLLGENKIVLADFKLGERVEAPDAIDLPLNLAIALLKGPDGRIEVAVPVRGDVHQPRFDYGTVLRAALANVIRQVVSSPFRLLAALPGLPDAEKLREVEFEPGSDSIAPAQREQLDKLAEALKKRSRIGLVVRGPYDAERDGKQLRRERAHRDLAIATGAASESGKPGEDLGLIVYGAADMQKALEKLLVERAGAGAVVEFAKEYAERTGRKPDRVNTLLGFFGVGSEDRAFYEALFERLAERQPLPDNALQSLAASRAQAIIDVMLEAGIDRNRLTSGVAEAVTGKPGAPVAAELSLDAAPGEP
ncbi:MAG: DUF748 domain-containing protein, partial [Nitrococcus sp.]|nr:DUF748 domain-containing protein [Nitrococcus sp.]